MVYDSDAMIMEELFVEESLNFSFAPGCKTVFPLCMESFKNCSLSQDIHAIKLGSLQCVLLTFTFLRQLLGQPDGGNDPP